MEQKIKTDVQNWDEAVDEVDEVVEQALDELMHDLVPDEADLETRLSSLTNVSNVLAQRQTFFLNSCHEIV
jgi:antitoxin component HigA of HigAB toxin-antitoxin module